MENKGGTGPLSVAGGGDCRPIDIFHRAGVPDCGGCFYCALLLTRLASDDAAVQGVNRDFAHGRELFAANDTSLKVAEDDVMST